MFVLEYDGMKKIYDILNQGKCLEHIICYEDYIIIKPTDGLYQIIYNNLKQINKNIKPTLIYGIISKYIDGNTIDILIANNYFKYESICISFIKQCFSIIKILHNKSIAHRDIKPQNIIMNNDEKVIFIDFGFACILDECKGIAGSNPFIPNFFKYLKKNSFEYYKFQDVYSIMMTFYLAFNNNEIPFTDTDKTNTYILSNSGFKRIDTFIDEFFIEYNEKDINQIVTKYTIDYLINLSYKFF